MTLSNISPKSRILILVTEELYGNSLILTQKNTCRGRLRALPNMSKLWNSLKPLALAQNKKKSTGFWNRLFLDASVTNREIFQSFVAGNENCSGKYRLLKFKYSQMITWKQTQSLDKYPCKTSHLITGKTKMSNLLKVTRFEKAHNRCNYTLHLTRVLNKFITFHCVSELN